jgi:hypothetical protein
LITTEVRLFIDLYNNVFPAVFVHIVQCGTKRDIKEKGLRAFQNIVLEFVCIFCGKQQNISDSVILGLDDVGWASKENNESLFIDTERCLKK